MHKVIRVVRWWSPFRHMPKRPYPSEHPHSVHQRGGVG